MDFGFEVNLQLLDVPVGQRAVARSIGMDLGAVKAHRAKLAQLHLLRHFEHLHKKSCELVEKTAAERGERVVIRVAVGSDMAKGD